MTQTRDERFGSHRISGEHHLGYHHFDPQFEPQSDPAGVTVLPCAHRFAILTCMDARIPASQLVGLPGSEAHVIRNAGARATEDAIRSLALSYKVLGTRAWYVVQHAHCGLALLTEEMTRDALLGPRHSGSNLRIAVPSAREGGQVDGLMVRDQQQSLLADVARLRNHPLVPADVPIFGYMFEAGTQRYVEVQRASEIGRVLAGNREPAVRPRAAAR
jgi:carbonic anhydrase